MRKAISIFALAALFASVAVLVCTGVDYNNPLDEKGTNYLNGLTGRDSVDALVTDDSGRAAYFTDPGRFTCDRSAPALTLVGDKSPTIYTNEPAEFRKWMNLDGLGWDRLIKWDRKYTDVTIKDAKLTRNGTDAIPFNPNVVPDASDNPYIIVYTAERPPCPGDDAPYKSTASRSLTIKQFTEIDSTRPIIGLIGGTQVSVIEGDKYIDQGVTITFQGKDIAPGALDSIVITGPSKSSVKKPITNYDGVVVPTTAVGATYTITYYATAANGYSATPVARKVTVMEKSQVGTPKAVIELNPYKHTIGGKTIYHKDTAIVSGGTYVEKGVKRAYYVKDGKEILVTGVSVELPATPNTNGAASTQRSLAYKLGAGAGWAKADDETRYVYLVDTLCDGKVPPEITEKGSSTIKAGQEWKYNDSWSVTNKDTDDGVPVGGAGKQYIIDFGGMDPKNPRPGEYTVTYVGLGGCGSTASKERKIKVE